jgi:hypothetical protein
MPVEWVSDPVSPIAQIEWQALPLGSPVLGFHLNQVENVSEWLQLGGSSSH